MNDMDNLNKKEKVAIYIDGSNFYGYLKDEEINFPKETKFDFTELSENKVSMEMKVVKQVKSIVVNWTFAPLE